MIERLLPDRLDPEEIASRVFMWFLTNPGKEVTWVMVKWRMIDELRKGRRELEVLALREGDDVAEPPGNLDDETTVARIIDKAGLEWPDQQLLYDHFYAGLDTEALAVKHKTTASIIRRKLGKVIEMLRLAAIMENET